jgi:hypothetical protein
MDNVRDRMISVDSNDTTITAFTTNGETSDDQDIVRMYTEEPMDIKFK